MEGCHRSSWLLLLIGLSLFTISLHGVQGEAEIGPSESECRPYIEKALKEMVQDTVNGDDDGSKEDVATVEITTDDGDQEQADAPITSSEDDDKPKESNEDDNKESSEDVNGKSDEQDASDEKVENLSSENKTRDDDDTNDVNDSVETKTAGDVESGEDDKEDDKDDDNNDSKNSDDDRSGEKDESGEDKDGDGKPDSLESQEIIDKQEAAPGVDESKEDIDSKEDDIKEDTGSKEDGGDSKDDESGEREAVTADSKEDNTEAKDDGDSKEDGGNQEDGDSKEDVDSKETDNKSNDTDDKSQEIDDTSNNTDDKSNEVVDKSEEEEDGKSKEVDKSDGDRSNEDVETKDDKNKIDGDNSKEDVKNSKEEKEGDSNENDSKTDDKDSKEDEQSSKEGDQDSEVVQQDSKENQDSQETEVNSAEIGQVEELTMETEAPADLRPRDHVYHLLKLDDEHEEQDKIINRVADITLRELKRLYENAIKPLETLYKYRDLSNRHFGDSEIFSKPLVLFMGPWSGGKSSIINYLLDNEYNETSLRTGAEPSPAYFNILMYGDEPEVLDGTQLAADYTFSGLQKFGQGLEERLRGLKLPNKLLEKINIVEIPGILEVRKQISRVFPFNDACQWFIDRADLIFLIYDPSKLDVGPETEAILDQLKGREYQTRIVLNKADQVKPEELMRVQGALIWNISPLMSSAQPPIMYTTSLWSKPYEPWAPTKLLQAQERAFLRDLRSAIDKRIENKISSARRFAVRVRNHAKMVDCYLTTYYNHKSVFGNKKQVADQIIEHPQDYHIYEGLSTLTNISRYDLPDPDSYKDFFKLNPLYEFQQLSATCTYFRGCPINRLDVVIAYDLPELVGKHKKLVETALVESNQSQTPTR